jgi:hypothetical protein
MPPNTGEPCLEGGACAGGGDGEGGASAAEAAAEAELAMAMAVWTVKPRREAPQRERCRRWFG